MNKRKHKKALKEAQESGNTKKVFDLTHRQFVRSIAATIKEYEGLISKDMPYCSEHTQKILKKVPSTSKSKTNGGR